MSFLNDENRLNLQEMVRNSDANDNTSKIRNLKHSKKIKNDVQTILNLKRKYKRMEKNDKKKFEKLVISHCNFLWNNYTNIFNRLMKDELNMKILSAFISALEDIEDGKLDQHEASAHIGQILKELYIDSALKREKKLKEKDENGNKIKKRKPSNNISWGKYKEAYVN